MPKTHGVRQLRPNVFVKFQHYFFLIFYYTCRTIRFYFYVFFTAVFILTLKGLLYIIL